MKTHTTTSSSISTSFSESSSQFDVDTQQPPDEALMASIQQRDATALETLMQRYRRLLKSAIMRTVNDDAAAEDVLQECFYELWRQADHYSPAKGRPLAWLMTLGKRRAIDHLRRSMAYGRAKDRMEESIQQADTFTQDSAAECEQADMGRVLGEHLSLLPDAQKEVIELAFLKGMSQREVAQATHSPLGTVKTRMELGLKKLRQTFRTRSSIHTLQAA
ncbi:sigma-70 family RNA polymerase sigma factor [Prosthecobacter sp.]|uniref:sigma-70 family RNA polymerase sigma factor n=1 Tax=Prosthecobacter sp. TaxID=1965333 RepID=UPI002489004F|nr:sigma-70 family RNA polymerase sigma factor [Prosthecobacter sp.]MDI1312277.1 sigma-70 family RNA polymerase sigma factor [Prosthecobacter sp.]